MFTHRNNEKDNERGALMIEAIALLGLMTMMSPMVVRQTADRTAEMEEVAIAGQMKEIKDALSNWIEANYQEKAKEFSAGNKVDESFAVSAADLAPYLPATYLNGNQFRGNKLVDGFDVGVRAQCTEVSKDDGTECTAANNCYELDGGAVKAIPAGAKCSRYKMTGVVLSKSDNNEEIDDRRASRIASMIGADGGYMRTKKLVESLYGSSSGGSGSNPDGAVPEMQKIVGSQGMWEGDVTKYIPGVSTNIGGKVAATTIFSSGFSGDYLYRKKVDGLPGANSMFTDLDMGGATECEGDGCHKINNAGGLEVVGGKILIRSQNTNDDQGISSGDAFAKIALATDNSHMHVSDSINLSVGASISGNSVNGGTQISLRNGTARMSVYDGTALLGTNTSATYLQTNTSGFQLFSGRGGGEVISKKGSDGYGTLNLQVSSGPYGYGASIGNHTLGATTAIKMRGGYANTSVNIAINNGVSYMNLTQRDLTANISNDASTMFLDNEVMEVFIGKETDSLHSSFALQRDLAELSINGTASTYLDTERAETIVNNGDSSFALHAVDGFTVNIGRDDGDMPEHHMAFNEEGLTLHSTEAVTKTSASYSAEFRKGHKISFNTTGEAWSEQLAAIAMVNATAERGKAIAIVSGDVDEDLPLLSFYGNSGRISGVFFQPERLKDGEGIIQDRASLGVDGNTGKTDGIRDGYVSSKIDLPNKNKTTNNFDATTASVYINFKESNKQAPYFSHYDRDLKFYDKFRVDPAFVSVMNDIKITSRGGARLSEALPNYILKGIYELSNSYGSGPWPCSRGTRGNCSFAVPYYTRKALGLSSGGWEFNCGGTGDDGSGNHPIVNGGGKCECYVYGSKQPDTECKGKDGSYKTGKYVVFKYNTKASYKECPSDSFCWAHPFLGKVPAPGRRVKTDIEGGTEYLYAQDEGVCPDGYQAVITVTPTVFELGKVSFINSNKKPSDASVAYNPGWQNYANANIADVTGIMQQATKLGLVVEAITSGNQIDGWRIAMGTVTPVSTDINDDGYIWNAGGIPANSWSAIAHTYCYFNPARFNMPNMHFMKLKNDGSSFLSRGKYSILTPQDNPMLENAAQDNFMN